MFNSLVKKVKGLFNKKSTEDLQKSWEEWKEKQSERIKKNNENDQYKSGVRVTAYKKDNDFWEVECVAYEGSKKKKEKWDTKEVGVKAIDKDLEKARAEAWLTVQTALAPFNGSPKEFYKENYEQEEE
jgi:hypothetical protein